MGVSEGCVWPLLGSFWRSGPAVLLFREVLRGSLGGPLGPLGDPWGSQGSPRTPKGIPKRLCARASLLMSIVARSFVLFRTMAMEATLGALPRKRPRVVQPGPATAPEVLVANPAKSDVSLDAWMLLDSALDRVEGNADLYLRRGGVGWLCSCGARFPRSALCDAAACRLEHWRQSLRQKFSKVRPLGSPDIGAAGGCYSMLALHRSS